MRLLEGVRLYIEAKHSQGMAWAKGAQILHAFHKSVGNLSLDLIHVYQIEPFLGGPSTSSITWSHKYGVLDQFFRYWVARQAMGGLPLPPRRRPAVQTFVPYIYSRSELRRLLVATRIAQQDFNCVIEAQTFRTFLLFLYGTGAMLGEAMRLERRDIDFRRHRITIRSSRFQRSREIPIGSDLYQILLRYRRVAHRKRSGQDPHFFLTTEGSRLKDRTIHKTFERVRALAGIRRNDGAHYQPRLHDLRHTFAVHRMTAWFKHGADLNRMIPALAAYMGQCDLGSTERYLALTPERFRRQLNTLSPKRGKKRWRDDAELMRFLDSL